MQSWDHHEEKKSILPWEQTSRRCKRRFGKQDKKYFNVILFKIKINAKMNHDVTNNITNKIAEF
jgi:hypothetical protein